MVRLGPVVPGPPASAAERGIEGRQVGRLGGRWRAIGGGLVGRGRGLEAQVARRSVAVP